MEAPFIIGQKVFKWSEKYVYGEQKVLSPRQWTVIGIRMSEPNRSRTGWLVDCESVECPYCGNPASVISGWDSSWFVGIE